MTWHLERSIESKVVAYAIETGWLPIKMTMRGLPDRAFFKDGRTVFIEFKRPGQRQRKNQRYYSNLLKRKGFRVYVCDDVDAGKRFIDEG